MKVRAMCSLMVYAPLISLAAQGHGSDMSVGVRVGTLGIGAEVSKLLTSHVGIRVGANTFSYDKTLDQSDISFDGKLKLKAVTGLLDLYPGKRGSFHVTVGVASNPATVTGTGVPNGSTFEINHHTYNSSDVGTLTGTAEWPSASPYVGLGFGTPASSHSGIGIVFDIGAVIGKAKVGLTSTGAATNPTLQSDLTAQTATTQTDVNKVPIYPVISFGLVFKF